MEKYRLAMAVAFLPVWKLEICSTILFPLCQLRSRGSTLTTASNSSVLLASGALAGNVFWQVDSSSTLGTASAFVGNLIAFTSDTLTTGASVMGRVFALGGAVTLDTNNITAAASAARRGGGGGDSDGDDHNGCQNDNGDRDKNHHEKNKDHDDKDKDHPDKDHKD